MDIYAELRRMQGELNPLIKQAEAEASTALHYILIAELQAMWHTLEAALLHAKLPAAYHDEGSK